MSEAYIFDLDGTIYMGEHALPGAVELVSKLRQMGKKTLFISNKPLEPRHAYAEKLTRLGIPTSTEDVLNSAYILGRYLSTHFPDLNLYIIGEESLRQEFRSYSLNVVDELWDQDPTQVMDTSSIDAIVVAFDRTLTYRKINTAHQALSEGARFFATNADKACPMPNGKIPDAGATLVMLEYLSGRKVELVAGKPSPMVIQAALDILCLHASSCLLIGDRLETDIRMGIDAGMKTALVLTGVSSRHDLGVTDLQPDLVLNDLTELLEHIR